MNTHKAEQRGSEAQTPCRGLGQGISGPRVIRLVMDATIIQVPDLLEGSQGLQRLICVLIKTGLYLRPIKIIRLKLHVVYDTGTAAASSDMMATNIPRQLNLQQKQLKNKGVSSPVLNLPSK